MTIQVKIERTDTTTTAARVKVEDKVFVDGVETDEWRTVRELELPRQGLSISGEYLTKTRRLVVEEF